MTPLPQTPRPKPQATEVGVSMPEHSPACMSMLEQVRSWARSVATRRRRLDLIEDIAAEAIAFLLEYNGLHGPIPPECERHVVRALELTDSFSTARDGDLTARVNERSKDRGDVASYLEELVPDPHGEDELLAQLDGEPRQEGRDLSEIQAEAAQAAAELTLEEDQLLSLRFQYGYTQREIGQYMGSCQTAVCKRLKRYRERVRLKAELADLQERAQDPEFTKLEVEWITL